ncbi:alpha/beta fold hydrolase [Nocardia asiatica]|uniref:alpha/beta fold hydrolase n=1 Tax=Nocardia asiatica TaxID=209252 RepID=UPI000A0638C0|nr:alpha/beta hydrolase [Nocardia asiatica]
MTQSPGTPFHEGTVTTEQHTLVFAEAAPAHPKSTIVSLPGSAGLEMSTAKDVLAQRHRVVEINPPGWGERNDVTERSHQSTLGPVLAAAIEELVTGPFYLLGTSMGGANALYVASLLPDRTQGVILEGSMAPVLPPEDMHPMPSPPEDGGYPLPAPHPRKPWATKDFVMNQMLNRARLFEITEVDMDAADAIAKVVEHHIPVLALLGDADEILRPSQEKRIRERIPHAQFHLVGGGGHDLQNTAPEIFVELVEEFVNS